MTQPQKTNVMNLHEPSEHLSWMDIHGRDVTVEIVKVVRGEITGEKGRKKKMPMVSFKGATKALGLNKTNTKTLVAMYGAYVEDWVGRRCTLYVGETTYDGAKVKCIRIRPQVPSAKQATDESPTPPPNEPTAEEQAIIAAREAEEAARG